MIEYLAQVDPATWATVAAGLGSAAAGLGGKWFGHRQAVRKIEAGAAQRISGVFGHVVDQLEERCADLEGQLRESRGDRTSLRDELAELRVRMRTDEGERRILAERFDLLLDHVRVLRAILGAHRIDHPAGPDFLDDGGTP